jgi:predicted ATPase
MDSPETDDETIMDRHIERIQQQINILHSKFNNAIYFNNEDLLQYRLNNAVGQGSDNYVELNNQLTSVRQQQTDEREEQLQIARREIQRIIRSHPRHYVLFWIN